ncbi:HtaA domain-containing protein [Salinibacterium sp. ZJ450]|uniref:HtaA domain-containing protein n=1 Tax=Salinibacterium sp. ZJ450 TaxID=2708338 RepID=UPI001421D9D0|nr:HtaA domain-containing protein [Salinibacterium sp. ZJ450]
MIHALSSAILTGLLAVGPAPGLLGAPPAVADSSTPAVACAITAGEIEWGFKESFRSYISGTIANGEWTVADGATYETPTFRWSDGTGAFRDGQGTVRFDGSVTFSGHGDILSTTISSPTVEIHDTDTAILLVDVSGTTQAGDPVDAPQTEFAELRLSEGTREVAGEQVTLSGVPVTLLEDGAAAFGTYDAGTAMDPITLRYQTPAGCSPQNAAAFPWLPWRLLVLVAALAAIAFVVTLLRRRGAPSAV